MPNASSRNPSLNTNTINVDDGRNSPNNDIDNDPLGIFPKRNETGHFGDLSAEQNIRQKFPQLFLANHLSQLKNSEEMTSHVQHHHSRPLGIHSQVNIIRSLQLVNYDTFYI